MQVNKLRIGTEGPVPAGRYFAQIAENLRAQNMRAAAEATRAETQERRIEARYRRPRKSPTTAHAPAEHAGAM
jgi:hypothetical protein